MSVLNVLARSKEAFCGDTDRTQLMRVLDQALPSGHIRWLDVGVGDGGCLLELAHQLGGRRTLSITGVDPDLLSYGVLEQLPGANLVCSKIEDCNFETQFDCINVRQSAYYFQDPMVQLRRMSSWLDLGGILAITLWTRECALCRLHHFLADRLKLLPNELGIEAVERDLRKLPGLELVARERIPGRIDGTVVTSDRAVAVALFNLAARNLDTQGVDRERRVELVRDYFAQEAFCDRCNGIAVFRRSEITLPNS